ncbi:MAG: prepilin-type N-terminal cleavage/methylation domain-containing protein [Spirochaetes bacterium]|nr:prepilin-type N-terminal cleavage/methylation domain-containing protein [Spirochaetota bacterium]
MRKQCKFRDRGLRLEEEINTIDETFFLKAYTLLELLIVLSIISIVFFIVTPRFVSSINPQKTRNFVLRMQNTLTYLSDRAILGKKVYLFTLDLEERRYFFTVSEEGNETGEVRDRYLVPVSFPDNLVLKSVKIIPGNEVIEGKAVIPFTPNGMLFSFEIVIEERGDRYYLVLGNSFNNRITVLKKSSDRTEVLY